MDRKQFQIKFFDVLIFIAVFTAGMFLLVRSFSDAGQADTVLIEADGVKYEYSLSKDGVYSVKGPLGYTVVEVKDQRVRVTDSPCPGKNCVNLGYSDVIICIPNNVYVSVKKSGGYDAVVQ